MKKPKPNRQLAHSDSPSIGGGWGEALALRLTEDGSHTLYLPAIDETYHSIHGAINESKHVFIEAGLSLIEKTKIAVLEIGFGTGLNAILTAQYAALKRKQVHFTSIEKFPLEEAIWSKLNSGNELNDNKLYKAIQKAEWGKDVLISPNFSLLKIETDLNSISLSGTYDCIFFDAFSPEKQPELWTEKVFEMLFSLTKPGGVLTTYCAKGAVRRAMQAAGFTVERIPGPVGKREMLRARKNLLLDD